jgi:hypothetical protein
MIVTIDTAAILITLFLVFAVLLWIGSMLSTVTELLQDQANVLRTIRSNTAAAIGDRDRG